MNSSVSVLERNHATRRRGRSPGRSGFPEVVLALTVATFCVGAAPEDDRLIDGDCGVKALFLLSRIEGYDIRISDLQHVLPRRDSQGFSLGELVRAAGALGMRLDAVKLPMTGRRPDRPMIAFFQEGGSGHFAVVRPVGVTGKLVQVIDPPHEPAVIDFDRMSGSRIWTGRILLSRHPYPLRTLVSVGSAIGAALFLALGLWKGGPSGPWVALWRTIAAESRVALVGTTRVAQRHKRSGR